ncbi:Hsp20/alpha crystallin family protein [Thioalkalivibrio sp. ALMg13-2]|uniref:Hsp20/alpha crystallin family protein n=1 Tax=Thioalkalivibrio sp. ALMg13-2 TaxID=1158167 RepID=UPI0003693104|nr:Hsp20/alpha crystallin family protein [Thioalkalivibrio sp. ALMg13-2]
MDLQKLKPWNWFKREETASTEVVPARREGADPLMRMHREMDRMFEDFFGSALGMRGGDAAASLLLKPSVDIAETRKAYRISVEVPGIDEDAIDLTVDGDDLIISGEKRQETEEDAAGYHRVERAYGQFRRILSLPGDADIDAIQARFKNGVLKIDIPRRKDDARPGVRRIEIGS